MLTNQSLVGRNAERGRPRHMDMNSSAEESKYFGCNHRLQIGYRLHPVHVSASVGGGRGRGMGVPRFLAA